MNVKKKQHYVWEHYLKGWATNGRVWCKLAQVPEPQHTSTENLGQQRYFYRLKEMSAFDLSIVDGLISRMGEHLQPLARGWIPHFTEPHRIKHEYEASGQSIPELETELNLVLNNMEEDIHAGVEEAAVPVLRSLREGDTSILADDQTFVDFARFIGMQYFRTPRMVRRFIEAGGELPNFNVAASTGLMRTIFAHNVGFELNRRRRTTRFTFLTAPGGSEFVTGDQPIINARAAEGTEGVAPEDLEYYYPVTPTRALLIYSDHTQAATEHRLLNAEEAEAYNRRIVAASEGQVYGRTKEALLAALAL